MLPAVPACLANLSAVSEVLKKRTTGEARYCAGLRLPYCERITMATKRVLFVCVENSNRSQMAEAFARIHSAGTDGIEIHSAGSRPSGVVNPKAIEAMREKGYDLSVHRSKCLDDLPQVQWDAVVTMGCGDECPFLVAKRREDWALPDPKLLPPQEFRKVRDEIENRVKTLLKSLA